MIPRYKPGDRVRFVRRTAVEIEDEMNAMRVTIQAGEVLPVQDVRDGGVKVLLLGAEVWVPAIAVTREG